MLRNVLTAGVKDCSARTLQTAAHPCKVHQVRGGAAERVLGLTYEAESVVTSSELTQAHISIPGSVAGVPALLPVASMRLDFRASFR